MPKQTTLSDVLRATLNDSIDSGEESFRSLERKTGIVRQSLMPFARGEQTLMLHKADLLAEFFGLELKPGKRKGGN